MLVMCSAYFQLKLCYSPESDADFGLADLDLNKYVFSWLSSNGDGHCFSWELKI